MMVPGLEVMYREFPFVASRRLLETITKDSTCKSNFEPEAHGSPRRITAEIT